MSSITVTAADAATIRRMVAEGWTPDAAMQHVARMRRQKAQDRPTAPEEAEKVSGVATDRRRTPQRDSVPPERDDLPAPEPLNEKQWQGMVEVVFRERGWMLYHTYDSRRSEPGFPDICAAHEQHGVIFAELKMPNGTLSKHQRKWIDRLHDAGARVYVWKPEDWAAVLHIADGGK